MSCCGCCEEDDDPRIEKWLPWLALGMLMMRLYRGHMTISPDAPAPAPGRHPSTQRLLKFFEHAHLPAELAGIAAPVRILAHDLADVLPDGPELSAGLRKLLEAKDCFVRAQAEGLFPDNPHTLAEAQAQSAAQAQAQPGAQAQEQVRPIIGM